MKAKIFFLSLVAFFALSVQAAVVDTINVRSDAMNKEIQTVIVLPGSGKITAPVIYLLHCIRYADRNCADHLLFQDHSCNPGKICQKSRTGSRSTKDSTSCCSSCTGNG